jgi:diguanylate cyclase (GGDEF)-like protein
MPQTGATGTKLRLAEVKSAGPGPDAEAVRPLAVLDRGPGVVPFVVLPVVLAGAVAAPSWGRIGAACGVGLLTTRRVLDRRSRREERFAPIVATAAVALAVLGLTGPSALPWDQASPATFTTTLAYPLLAWALLQMAALRKHPYRIDAVVTGALGALSAGIGAWSALPVSSTGLHATVADQFTVVAPLALAVFVLLVSLRLVRISGSVWSWWALNGGFGALLVAHVMVVAASAGATPVPVSAELGRGLGCLLVGVGLFHPSRARLVEPSIIEPRIFGVGHVSVVVVAALATPAVLAVEARTREPLPVAVTIGAGGVGVVLAIYLVGLLQERARSEHRGNHDRLTGLPNRTLFVDRVERALIHAHRSGSPLAVFFLDVDRFKAINDTFGHSAGDLLLRVLAQRLARCLRDEDTVARISGDEFALLLPHLSSPTAAITVAERIMAALAEPLTLAENRVTATASMGIAIGPADGRNAELLLASADAAMYRAKERGRNTFEVYDSRLATRAHARLETESALLDALERDELVVHYQPIVAVSTGEVVGAEALVRWNHPTRGLLFPGHFVPIAEESDLVVELGDQVLRKACEAAARWRGLGLGALSVSVNVAARQFRFDLTGAVTSALRASGLEPRRLTLELTESAAVDNVELVAATLDELRRLGIRASIDDFGTGYCGLRYLSNLPVDNLKIDQSFVQGMTPTNASIVAATIAMAHSLGLSVTAEGVETEEQRAFLASRGCDKYQGYLLARPLPESEFLALAQRRNGCVADEALAGPRLHHLVHARPA